MPFAAFRLCCCQRFTVLVFSLLFFLSLILLVHFLSVIYQIIQICHGTIICRLCLFAFPLKALPHVQMMDLFNVTIPFSGALFRLGKLEITQNCKFPFPSMSAVNDANRPSV